MLGSFNLFPGFFAFRVHTLDIFEIISASMRTTNLVFLMRADICLILVVGALREKFKYPKTHDDPESM